MGRIQESDKSAVLDVRLHTGEHVGASSVYLPLVPEVLLIGKPLLFNVYLQKKSDELQLVAREGEYTPPDIKDMIHHNETPHYFYIRGDKRNALLDYQESLLNEVLETEDLTLDTKCHFLQNQTTLLSMEVFDKPKAPTIRKQRKNITRMVDFTLREPSAMRQLLGLVHHDYTTYTHSVNVGLYSLWIANEYFDASENHDLEEITTAFFLHDIGKCKIPSSIINKDGQLNDEEWIEIKKHPIYGYNILSAENNITPETAVVVSQHHERMDGKGYPYGLKGEEIHPYARVCSVADAFDALTTRRSYKEAQSPFAALSIMKEEMRLQFDPNMFETFVLLMEKGGHRKRVRSDLKRSSFSNSFALQA